MESKAEAEGTEAQELLPARYTVPYGVRAIRGGREPLARQVARSGEGDRCGQTCRGHPYAIRDLPANRKTGNGVPGRRYV